eukprot:TRINITY_DN22690_c0_g1_i1.p1 TRINITY_DN22690_c0_g1~~TRINITY_DN22690_c0_g1_i1.p1  ORF type:complete len:252 (-),score=21.34 TRINITY_DN22690_c0_g1_i1:430-1107(-)
MVPTSMRATQKDVSEVVANTRGCRFFGMGVCTRGSACKFAHASAEERPRVCPPRARTKMCPTLINTGSCADEKCGYAHSRADLEKKQRPSRRKKVSPGSCGTSVPSTLSPPLLKDAPSQSVDYSRARQDGSGVATGKRTRIGDGSICNMYSTRRFESRVASARSAKDDVLSEAFVHDGFLVVVKRTFINVEPEDATIPVGLSRASTSPGSIGRDEIERVSRNGRQ